MFVNFTARKIRTPHCLGQFLLSQGCLHGLEVPLYVHDNSISEILRKISTNSTKND